MKTSIPTHSFESETGSKLLWHNRQVNGTINLNIDEIAKRITDEKRWTDGIRSPQPWTHYLNKGFRESIQNIGLRHLLYDFNKLDLFSIAIQQALPFITRIGATPEQLIQGVVIQNIFVNAVWLILSTFNGEYIRPSLIYGPQLDRAAVFGIYLATHPLVKAV